MMALPIAQLSYLGPAVRSCPCRRCGRVLHDPGSIAIAAGPVCRRYLPQPTAMEIPMQASTVREEHPSSSRSPETPVYFGWQAIPKQSAIEALTSGLNRYRERNGHEAAVVLCHPATASELGTLGTVVTVLARADVPRGTFYLGAA